MHNLTQSCKTTEENPLHIKTARSLTEAMPLILSTNRLQSRHFYKVINYVYINKLLILIFIMYNYTYFSCIRTINFLQTC